MVLALPRVSSSGLDCSSLFCRCPAAAAAPPWLLASRLLVLTRYSSTRRVDSVLPAPDSPETRIVWSSPSCRWARRDGQELGGTAHPCNTEVASRAGRRAARAAAGLPHAPERRVGDRKEVRRHRAQRLVAVPRELLLRVERQLAPRVERDQDGTGVGVDGAFRVAAAKRVQQTRLAQVHELREVGRVVLLRPVLRQHLGGRQRGPRAAAIEQDFHARGAARDHGGRLPLVRSEVEGGPAEL